MKLFKKKNQEDKDKNKKLTGDNIRIRINRLINSTPVEIGIFEAVLKRDENNNTIIFDEENNLKEELPGLTDSLISDILYKLESRGLSLSEQISKVKENISNQTKLVSNQNNGYITQKNKVIDEEGKEKEEETQVKINIQTEKTKLRLLKCVLYTLENKKGEGYFESVELDGTRTLSYLVRDGDLIPYWHKTPNSEGEPVVLVPDVVQRKKFYKETTDETINDFNESQDTMWRGILGVITKGLYVVLALGLIVWTIYLARWSGDLRDESLQPQIEQLKLDSEKIRQLCSSQIANQIENNDVLIDWAKIKISQEMSIQDDQNIDKANLQI